ncbi:hypothetical protein [Microbacterium sp. NPDC056569]|uniref:hypothetical protein n=1 Tax=Microbacterium sp. NPDC056569 TaxID=3345867 RepID=UPI003671EDC3
MAARRIPRTDAATVTTRKPERRTPSDRAPTAPNGGQLSRQIPFAMRGISNASAGTTSAGSNRLPANPRSNQHRRKQKMSIFTRTPVDSPAAASAAVEAVHPGLPVGYDDEQGVYFVPDADRPFYAPQLEKAKHRARRDIGAADTVAWSHARELARAAAFAEFGPRPESPSESARRFIPDTDLGVLAEIDARQASWDAFVDSWIAEHAPEVERRRIAFHLIQLELAQLARAQSENREHVAADHRRRDTCPVCGECDPAVNGPVTMRDLVNAAANQNTRTRPFTSCVACFDVKRQLVLEDWAKARVQGGRTRRELLAGPISSSFSSIDGRSN